MDRRMFFAALGGLVATTSVASAQDLLGGVANAGGDVLGAGLAVPGQILGGTLGAGGDVLGGGLNGLGGGIGLGGGGGARLADCRAASTRSKPAISLWPVHTAVRYVILPSSKSTSRFQSLPPSARPPALWPRVPISRAW